MPDDAAWRRAKIPLKTTPAREGQVSEESGMMKTDRSKGLRMVLVCALVATTAACATRPPATDTQALARYRQANDPLEPMNRAMFSFNNGFYHYVLDPVTDGYEAVVPSPLRDMLRNFLRNISSPLYLINNLLQGDLKGAEVTVARFLTNTGLGFGGLFDQAAQFGMPARQEDFGQTLAIWGANEGAYLVLPFFGPSSARDATGFLADLLMDPFSWYLRSEDLSYLNWARTGMEGLDTYTLRRGDLKSVQQNSIDPYAAVRSLQRQIRNYEITNGKAEKQQEQDFPSDEDFPDFDSQ
jgi:phospholipid-binding lipoprotein MlaA